MKESKKPTISVSMIVKNESSCLRNALDSVQGVDEIVIIDTGSTDNTVEIAKEYTDKVYSGEEYLWRDDFSFSRNQSLNKCTGDWILIIDCDEELEPNGIEKIRNGLKTLPEEFNSVEFMTKAMVGSEWHWSVRLFKRIPEIQWKGRAHNYLIGTNPMKSGVQLLYGYSEAHALDPDRTLRILKNAVEDKPELSRERYYLAREYWYRKDYANALFHYEEYLKTSTFVSEGADAWLMKARCLWYLQRGEEARQSCLQAIYWNPEFKEALLFMAEMHYEPRKSTWLKFSEEASNENVLFVRK
jgi:glycosyltransferase involved in cell wall biosynthesis